MGDGEQAFETLRQVATEAGWNPRPREGRANWLQWELAGHNGPLKCFAWIDVAMDQLIFYVRPDWTVPEAKRARVAEFLMRINFGLQIGSFEMDYQKGEFRARSTVSFLEGELLPPHP